MIREELYEATQYDIILKQLSKEIGGSAAKKAMDVLIKNKVLAGKAAKPTFTGRWLVNFKGGGWNTVDAKTEKEALSKAKKEFRHDVVSVSPMTDKEYDHMIRMTN